jgi:hypothetical protein
MKQVFLIAVVLSFSAVVAQTPDNIQDWLKKFKPKSSVLKSPLPFTSAEVYFALPKGNRMYALPQDNMPCIVPDMHQFNMPVAKGKTVFPLSPSSPGAIPNPALPAIPFNITPGKRIK